MNVVFAVRGRPIAAINDANHAPREGDWISLNVTGTDEVFKVRRVVWNTQLLEGSEDKQGFARLHKEGDVFVFVESMEAEGGSSESSS